MNRNIASDASDAWADCKGTRGHFAGAVCVGGGSIQVAVVHFAWKAD